MRAVAGGNMSFRLCRVESERHDSCKIINVLQGLGIKNEPLTSLMFTVSIK